MFREKWLICSLTVGDSSAQNRDGHRQSLLAHPGLAGGQQRFPMLDFLLGDQGSPAENLELIGKCKFKNVRPHLNRRLADFSSESVPELGEIPDPSPVFVFDHPDPLLDPGPQRLIAIPTDLRIQEASVTGCVEIDDGFSLIADDPLERISFGQRKEADGESIGSIDSMTEACQAKSGPAPPFAKNLMRALQMSKQRGIHVGDAVCGEQLQELQGLPRCLLLLEMCCLIRTHLPFENSGAKGITQ